MTPEEIKTAQHHVFQTLLNELETWNGDKPLTAHDLYTLFQNAKFNIK